MHGRGYVKHGDKKAARFISNEFRKNHLIFFQKDYYQELSYPVNTFPGKIKVSVDHHPLIPGSEFVIASSSPSIHGLFQMIRLMDDTAVSAVKADSLGLSRKFVITKGDIKKMSRNNPFHSAGIILLLKPEENLWWHVSNGTFVTGHTLLVIRSGKLNDDSKLLEIKAKNRFFPNYRSQNVMGYIKGSEIPDSFLVITAHYDHLGMMGNKTYFPGANDNASGTAMMLDMARYYSLPENRPRCSMVFIALTGEETGLFGSNYFCDHPLFPLDKIRFLINLDMVGTGSDGITVVNGTVYKDDFDRMVAINEERKYVKEVAIRGESCNSDHCPFYLKGVPSIFIYTRGPEFNEYHNITDLAEKLPLTAYEGVFSLLTDFLKIKQ